jgi:L-asparaginase
MVTSDLTKPQIKPRIIIHGGAGNIRRENLPKASYEAYRVSLLSILKSASCLLSKSGATALDVATHAVTLLEDNPLFNCGKGAVFTRAGTVELESSIMVSNGYRKRGVGCMTLKTVKNPIKLAREMLVKGEQTDGGGGQGHSQLSGEYLEKLAVDWGMDIVEQKYFFTERRWQEHMKGLMRERWDPKTKQQGKTDRFSPRQHFHQMQAGGLDHSNGGPSWDGHEYLPQGTVGAVVLDQFGTICVATSTGGLTNKLPGRIGDTPTLGAGFWAEEWMGDVVEPVEKGWEVVSFPDCDHSGEDTTTKQIRHAIGMSGTGNGDSFLRTNAVRTAGAVSRFSTPNISLADAVSHIAGPGGELQKSAGDGWGKTGEGEGGIIGIELVGSESSVVWDFNCGGMFRTWIDDAGEHRFMAFREEF